MPERRASAPVASVTVTVEMSSAHRLACADRDAEWNDTVYGPCTRPNGHGHNYRLEVTVGGPLDPAAGWVLDAGELAAIVRREVVEPYHLRHLNLDVPFLAGVNPTAENLVEIFAGRVRAALPRGELRAVVLHETPKNRATWTPESPR